MSIEFGLGAVRGFQQGKEKKRLQDIQDTDRTRTYARQDEADANAREERDYQKSQRPMRERANAASVANAETGAALNSQKLHELTQHAQAEGMYDMLDQLDRGIDPTLALSEYNKRGAHRIDPTTFRYNRATKRVQFIDDDGQPRDGDVRQLKSVLDQNMRPPGSKETKMKADEALVRDGKVVLRGPAYGATKPTSNAGSMIKGKPGEMIWDKTTKKFTTFPGTPAGGKGSGVKTSPFNMQTHRKAIRDTLASSVGLKYDPQTEQIIGGKPGATDKWLEMASSADRVASQYGPDLGPAEVAHMVNDAYSGVEPRDEYRKRAEKETLRKQTSVWGTNTHIPGTEQESLADWQGRVNKDGDALYAQAVKDAETRLHGALPAQGSPDEEETPPNDDDAEAVDGGDDGGDGGASADEIPDDPSAPAADPSVIARSGARAALPAAAGASAPGNGPRTPGLKVPGNLDPFNRKVLNNPDGTVSTTSSMSIGTEDGEVLIPTVIDGKRLSAQDAIRHYRETGEHLGIFDDAGNADAYAEALHNEQARRLGHDPGTAAPAATGTARGGPPSAGAHYKVTLDRVTAGNDVAAQSALKALKTNPSVFNMLTAPVDAGKTAVVKFPDGKLYFLAGNELRQLKNVQPPAKAK